MCAHKGVSPGWRKSSCPCSRKVAAFPNCHCCLSRVLGIKCNCPKALGVPRAGLCHGAHPTARSNHLKFFSLGLPRSPLEQYPSPISWIPLWPPERPRWSMDTRCPQALHGSLSSQPAHNLLQAPSHILSDSLSIC